MALSLGFSIGILQDIKNVNNIKDGDERLAAFIKQRERAQEIINDEMDELFANVNLTTSPENRVRETTRASDILKTIRKTIEPDIQAVYDYNEMYDFMETFIETMSWYDRTLLNLYLTIGTYRGMEKASQIPWQTCYNGVQRVIKKIRVGASKHNIEFKRSQKTDPASRPANKTKNVRG